MSDDLRRPPAEAASALPVGTRLGEFEIRSLLGVGGFGIVYLAFDHALEREVAVKEYMPASMAGRTETMHVSLRSQSDAEVFALGLRSFVNEAKLLARFDHPSLLKVHRFWEANGTAYMAMPVLRGRTLKEIRQGRQSLENPIDERWLRGLLDPLLGALDRLHSEGVYHRDIAPDNILVEPDGHPVLLDFGAARRVIGDKTQTLTAILKPAYAPIEQYAEAGSVKQGPWTDLYALGATVHYMLLGHPPAPATARAVNDDQAPLAGQRIDGCSETFLHVVDWMLAPRPGDRPQSVVALREVLAGRAPLPQRRPAAAVSAAQWEPTLAMPSGSAAAAAAPSAALSAVPSAAPPMAAPTAASSSVPSSAAPVTPAARPADADSTVVVPPSRPPARAPAGAAPAPGAAAPSPAAAGASRLPGPTIEPARPPRRIEPSPAQFASGAAASAGRGRPKSAAIVGGIAAVAAVAVAAFAMWPRAADGPSAVVPAASLPAVAAAPGLASAPAATAAIDTPTTGGTATPGQAPSPATLSTASATPPPATQAPATATAPNATSGTAPVAAAAASTPASPTAALGVPSAAPRVPAAPSTSRPAGVGTGGSMASRAPEVAPRVAAGSRASAPAAAVPPMPVRVEPAPTTVASPTPAPQTAALPPISPAPAPTTTAAVPPAPAKASGPEARCGGRNPVSYFACMERECYRSEFIQHPDCLQWRKNARQRDPATGY